MRPTIRFSFLALEFRPFLLLAAGYALLAVPLGLLVFSGAIEPVSYLPPSIRHAHEMIFGFTMAVIADTASPWILRLRLTCREAST
ncbi:MAG TPA: NnrS family protein [Terriglobia bacterium]|nr:NnrS family protein [Terriglobia bacterium]